MNIVYTKETSETDSQNYNNSHLVTYLDCIKPNKLVQAIKFLTFVTGSCPVQIYVGIMIYLRFSMIFVKFL
jgi:hypothetical protein